MRLIETYLFRQLLWPTLAAAGALGGVALLSQSLTALDIVVDQRQGALVFGKIILLTMPQLLATVLPIALFVAALAALNRLHTEQEIVVCFSGGMSRWAVFSPAVRLAALAALLTLVVNLWVQPWSARAMREEIFRIRTDLVASLVREGEFREPAKGLTVYAQGTDQSGILRNVFIYQESTSGQTSTLVARRGFFAPDGAKALVLQKGSNQAYDAKGVLNYLGFDEYVFDLTPYITKGEDVHYKISDRYLHELIQPDLTQDWERQNRLKLLAEAHYRLSSPLYNFVFVALALWAVIGGPFSRLGYSRRIARAAIAAGVIRIVGFGAQAACDNAAWANVFQYAVPAGAFLVTMFLLFRQPVARTARPRRRRPRPVSTTRVPA
jgi:lipopolysaccharide export system permease protein